MANSPGGTGGLPSQYKRWPGIVGTLLYANKARKQGTSFKTFDEAWKAASAAGGQARAKWTKMPSGGGSYTLGNQLGGGG